MIEPLTENSRRNVNNHRNCYTIAMDVLREILTWSKNRPEWQRDALRRLVLVGELEDEDIDALTKICKSAHGLAEEQEKILLGKEHLPTNGA